MFCYLYFFLVCDFGPLPKNSVPNPMTFQFLVVVTLGPPWKLATPLGKSWLRHCVKAPPTSINRVNQSSVFKRMPCLPGSWHTIECAIFLITGQFCAFQFFKVVKSNYDVLRMAAELMCSGVCLCVADDVCVSRCDWPVRHCTVRCVWGAAQRRWCAPGWRS